MPCDVTDVTGTTYTIYDVIINVIIVGVITGVISSLIYEFNHCELYRTVFHH